MVLYARSALAELEGIVAFCFGVLTIVVIRGIELLKTAIEKLPNEIAEAGASGEHSAEPEGTERPSAPPVAEAPLRTLVDFWDRPRRGAHLPQASSVGRGRVARFGTRNGAGAVARPGGAVGGARRDATASRSRQDE
jgi:hypothetical protein